MLNDTLELAYPELFEDGRFVSAVQVNPDLLGENYEGEHPVDYILYISADFEAQCSDIVPDPSDHPGGVMAQLVLRSS